MKKSRTSDVAQSLQSACSAWRKMKVARGFLKGILIGGAVIVAGKILLPVLLWLGLAVYMSMSSCQYNPVQDVENPEIQSIASSILHGCNLKDRLKKVHHGYKTMAVFPGDHSAAYAIEITYVHVSELTQEHGWIRGDQINGDIETAVEWLLREARKENLEWFPTEREVKSADMFVKSRGICLITGSVSLVFVRPSDKMVFCIYIKT